MAEPTPILSRNGPLDSIQSCPIATPVSRVSGDRKLGPSSIFRFLMTMRFSSVLFALLVGLSFSAQAESAGLLKSGDRIAIIGNTLVERARLYGHLESALLLAAGDKVNGLVVRNLGWSADSVLGDSRSYFGTPQEGRDRLDKNISDVKPNIVFLSYGTGEAMSVEQGWTDDAAAAGTSAAGLEKSLALFVDGYQKLIDRVQKAGEADLREIVLLSPPPLENHGGYLPDQTKNNARIAKFRDAMRDLAKKNKSHFVDLFAALGGDDFDGSITESPLTDNGIHFTEEGYRVLARHIIKELGYDESSVTGLEAPAYLALREAVIEKNRLFFHRWRPANETYLFLFRKHEQGNNAKEIPMFDPLIAEQEKVIEAARKRIFAGITKN